MRKKIAGSFARWFLFLLCLYAIAFFCSSIIGLLCAALWFLIPLVSYGMNFLVRKHIRVTIALPAVASKKEAKTGTVTIHNNSFLSVAKLYCRINLKNCLTLESETLVLGLSAAPKGETEGAFEVFSDYCGYLQAEVVDILLMDWIGIVPVRCKVAISAKTAVQPDTFAPNVFLSMLPVVREDADAWSQIQKGNDQTEVFSLRDYVPGDSLRQIHWKLSSKRGELIVREASLPIEKSLLIFWDKNTQETSAKEMDAIAECVVSVCQAILNRGYFFSLGWTEGRQIVFEYIDSEDLLLQTVPRMLKYGPDFLDGSGAFLHSQEENRNYYGKVLYLAKTMPEDFVPFSCTDMTLILCNAQAVSNDWRTITFGAETYREDLDILDL